MRISDLLSFVGYKIQNDFISNDGSVRIQLDREFDREFICNKCGNHLGYSRGKHRIRLKHLPIFDKPCFIELWRYKRHCSNCKKSRSEKISFMAKESPHLTTHYVYWLAKLVEISTVKETAEFTGNDDSTLWRIDFNRLKTLFNNYEIPSVTKIAVDEVSSRKGSKHEKEYRNDCYFTVITDLDTKKVIWVSDSRNRSALDDFFKRLGHKRCQKIKLIATDQHIGFTASIEDHIPQAKHIYDKFHLMRNFEKAVDDTRKMLMKMTFKDKKLSAIAKRKRFVFLKKDSKRTDKEKKLINDVMEENKMFIFLELIKERMFTFFYASNSRKQAIEIIHEIRDWIHECGFKPLKTWYKNFARAWPKIRYYFDEPVTTAICEGLNNVIKMIKRRAFGYRNMDYFKLKILQKCGFLHSRYYSMT